MSKNSLINTINYLEINSGKSYKSAKRCSTEKEAVEMKTLYDESRSAMKAFNNIMQTIADEVMFVMLPNREVLNGSKTAIRDYFWVQLRDVEHCNNPECIAVFCEVNTTNKTANYRVSLEINDGDCSIKQLQTHNKVCLDNMTSDFTLFQGRKRSNKVKELSETLSSIDSNTDIYKVLLGINIDSGRRDSDDIYTDIINAINKIKPIYNKIFN